MGAFTHEWLNLLVRWVHVIAGIMWIGDSLFFMWLDSHLSEPEPPRDGVEGELWMVHSGGFYRVEKKRVTPTSIPPRLYWFKWEATATWISGFTLLLIVYYLGGALIDQDSSLSSQRAGMLALLSLPVAWLGYDTLWQSPLKTEGYLLAPLSLLLLIGLTASYSIFLSGRAAYIHIGAVLGTCMVLNVWRRILPAQNALIKATKEGVTPNVELAKNAKRRSVHNNYMTFPILFIMISNHFPTVTYGYQWSMLALIMVFGAAIRHYFNVRPKSSGAVVASFGTLVLVVGALLLHPRSPADEASPNTPNPPAPKTKKKTGALIHYDKLERSTLGTLSGRVEFSGEEPKRRQISMTPVCLKDHKTPPLEESLLVNEGGVENVFVYIKSGLEKFEFETTVEPVVISQKGCLYIPHVAGAQVGQPVVFENGDQVLHNVHTLGKNTYNFAQPHHGMLTKKNFRRTEVMTRVNCDVHPWMNAYVGVLKHPFFAVTTNGGTYKIPEIPPGDYEIGFWHESLGTRSRRITLASGAAAKLNFQFEKTP